MKMAVHLKEIHEKQVRQNFHCRSIVVRTFLDQIQSISWHPTEAQNLLTGSADKNVRLVDCRQANERNSQKRWTFDSEVERVAWNTFEPNQFLVKKQQLEDHRSAFNERDFIFRGFD